MKTQEQQRMVGAEIALMLTVVEVCLIALSEPAVAEYGVLLVLPFVCYGLFYVIFVEPNS